MSDSYRVAIDAAGPAPGSVVLKLAAADETSRATGAALGLYEREVRFYRDIAPLIGGPVPATHAVEFDEAGHAFALLMSDAAPARQGDEIAGATRAEADAAITALALSMRRCSATSGRRAAMARPRLADQRRAHEVPARRLPRPLRRARFGRAPVVCHRFVASFDGWATLAEAAPTGLVHGDYRLDNLLFGDGAAGAAHRGGLADRGARRRVHRPRVLPRLRVDGR